MLTQSEIQINQVLTHLNDTLSPFRLGKIDFLLTGSIALFFQTPSFFTRRENGFGDIDIYISKKDVDEIKYLGTPINSNYEFNDESFMQIKSSINSTTIDIFIIDTDNIEENYSYVEYAGYKCISSNYIINKKKELCLYYAKNIDTSLDKLIKHALDIQHLQVG